MKKLVQINGGIGGSTGFIMRNISAIAEKNGWESYMVSPLSFSHKKVSQNHILVGIYPERILSRYALKFTGYSEQWNLLATYSLIRKMKRINPDIIHLHNLHGNYLNIPILFKYLRDSKARIVWTLHDCWTFTGGCAYFDMCGCGKWKGECGDCPQLGIYPNSSIDRTKKNLASKDKLFQSILNKTVVVTPSKWLCDLAKQSYWNGCEVRCIYNGINLNVFSPKKSDILKGKLDSQKTVLMGVATGWTKRKGIDVFNQLADLLPDDFQIILVGNISENVKVNSKILCWGNTDSQEELARLYSMADIFVNPTREEVFGMVNIEALACGTPVITFNTGGAPESIDETCGIVIEKNDVVAMKKAIIKVDCGGEFYTENCCKRAMQFDMETKFVEYIDLYNDIIMGNIK